MEHSMYYTDSHNVSIFCLMLLIWCDSWTTDICTYTRRERTAYAIILPLFCNTVDDCYGDEAAADVVAAVHADVVEDKDVDDDAMHILMIVHEIQPIYDSKF